MKIFTFPNGFRVIYDKPNSEIPLTSILGFVQLGSIYEKDGIRGASHFIEHMCFKGTKRRPNSEIIIKNYDRIGAHFNAYTEKEYTCYEIKCDEEHLANCIHVLSDMMLNSVFNKTEFTKEHNVVIEENIKSQDNLDECIQENSEFLIYEGSPHKYPIDTLSYHKKSNVLKYSDVVKTYNDYYTPNNMVLSIVSHISFSKIKSILKNTEFMKQVPEKSLFFSRPPLYVEPQTQIKYDLKRRPDSSALHLRISFRTCSTSSSDRFALNLLSNIVGNTFSSRLFMILRENNGLTYSCDSSTKYYLHSGDFSISATLNPQKILENGEKKGVLPLILDLLNDLYKNGVNKEEMTLFKGYIKGQHHIEMEDSYNKCEYNGQKLLLTGEDFTPYEKIIQKNYLPISKTDVHSIIQKYFKKTNMTVCLLGPGIPSLERIKRTVERFLG